MKKFLIAASTLVCLMAAPLTAQAATTSSQTSTTSEMPRVSKHATVRHHTARRHATRHHSAMNQAKKNVNCPPGSQNAACHPSTTGSAP
jgi:Ni/Co efflux regulator RcnB